MSARPGEELIEAYLRQLRQALPATSPQRRDQIVSDVAQHIAEARAEEPSSDELTISRLLDRIGAPEAIADEFEETSEDSGQATGGKPAPPSSVRAAVRLMYAGAALSVVTALADLLTRSSLKSAIEHGLSTAARVHGFPRLTTSQVNSSVTALIVMSVVVSVIGALLWVFIARASTAGQWSARITATGLFGLDTLALLTGPADLSVRGPAPRITEACLLAVWLTGLAVIALLWRRSSGKFLSGSRSRSLRRLVLRRGGSY
jgi:hypothetical protein